MAKPRKTCTSAPDPPVAVVRLLWHPPAPAVPTVVLISLAALRIRVLVSVGPYSGQGAAPKFGDYDAQRHWMELTLHLTPADWYRNTSDNDLAYWGLDYSPLSAYQSLLHGRIINASLPEAVALRSSRGYESMESYAPSPVDFFLLFAWKIVCC
ncbi:putative dolichyl pyrophosphate Man9GlcNAc2 alpha-1,3-glucosyltransferase [Zea mays]|uniref:Alpha-1,3-glucosyltransferase n=1 Tax=Zea mays TaxID=4577 RepID=A0A3L6GBK9_MAIZE|nr:putative dolichyl pyrophosphate Man9GlcNAc2 alpha-1,3-glucosyltransferase [Zea mays]